MSGGVREILANKKTNGKLRETIKSNPKLYRENTSEIDGV